MKRSPFMSNPVANNLRQLKKRNQSASYFDRKDFSRTKTSSIKRRNKPLTQHEIARIRKKILLRQRKKQGENIVAILLSIVLAVFAFYGVMYIVIHHLA